jgi:hypothetical protein
MKLALSLLILAGCAAHRPPEPTTLPMPATSPTTAPTTKPRYVPPAIDEHPVPPRRFWHTSGYLGELWI